MALSTFSRDSVIIPCTVLQLVRVVSEYQLTGPVVLFGKKPTAVRMVGKAKDVVMEEGKIEFIFYDGTAACRALMWLDGLDDVSMIREGVYMTVNGRPDVEAGEPKVTLYNASELKDFNGITHHFLECCSVALDLGRQLLSAPQESGPAKDGIVTAGPKDQIGSPSEPNGPKNRHVDSPDGASVGGVEVKDEGAGACNVQGSPMACHGQYVEPMDDDEAGFVDVEQLLLDKVMEIVRARSTSVHGVSVQEIIEITGVTEEQVSAALEKLMDYGDVYSTLDEKHFKSV